MLISSDAHAAQSQSSGRATKFFDDIGCLAADPDTRDASATRYVRLASGSWTAVDATWFARSASVRTPMDYGILAFATEEEARAADRDGQAHGWPAIVSFATSR